MECWLSVHGDRAKGRNHGVAMLLGSSTSIGTRWRRSCGSRKLLKLVPELLFVEFRCWKLPEDNYCLEFNLSVGRGSLIEFIIVV